MIPRVPHPWRPGPYPYDLLEAAGLTPLSTHVEILDGSMRLMAEGKMTAEMRLAWDEVRTFPRRLATDFFLYNAALCEAEAVAREALRRLEG
jgi:hypothetical protein